MVAVGSIIIRIGNLTGQSRTGAPEPEQLNRVFQLWTVNWIRIPWSSKFNQDFSELNWKRKIFTYIFMQIRKNSYVSADLEQKIFLVFLLGLAYTFFGIFFLEKRIKKAYRKSQASCWLQKYGSAISCVYACI